MTYNPIFKEQTSVIAYHGGNAPIRRFAYKYSAFGNFWFSENLQSILDGSAGAGSTDYIMTVKLDVGRVAGWDLYDKLLLDQIAPNFDSIHLDDDWIMFDSKRIKVLKVEKRK